MALVTIPLGPFTRGVQDTRNPSLDPQGALRYARNLMYTGVHALSVRPGTQTMLTLFDDQGPPESVSHVVAIAPFQDGAIAIAHSETTQKVYLYRLPATMDGWYDSTGTLQGDFSPEPVGVLWSGMATAPDVSVTEGLGVAYIANTAAADDSGLYWPTKTFTGNSTIDSLVVNGTGGSAGTDVAYFNGVVAFQQHLWGFGYGAGSTPGSTSYRPELARFSQPNFDPFQTVDSITLGDRVRSQRERIIAGAVAGNALFLGGADLLTRVTGYGRDSWYKTVLDRSYGFVGPKCFVTAGSTLYYWSPQGPMRVTDSGTPDPLWDAIPAAVARVANTAKITAGFDVATNQVLFFYDSGTGGVRTFCAFDVRREVWLGPDADSGIPIHSTGYVAPLYQSNAQAPIGPSGAPTIVSTSTVGTSSATATWTNGDPLADTELSYRQQGGSTYTTLPVLAAGTTTYTFSGLSAGVAYEWRVRHVRNGQYSSYAGPSAASQFTTSAAALQAPSSLVGLDNNPSKVVSLYWTNSGESGVQTEVWELAPDGGSFGKVQTVATGVASTNVTVGQYGSFQFKVRHAQSGATSSDFSNTVTVNVAPYA